ncbi:hypothetical protein [Thalassobius sp. Cn5-15]|uniref:hypothetical protein n=1 Tax=Thalassobius sp. Cn5-15 TaxID=2917763 RepID=UPI001EF262B0|nr:hypothetical protein [Thalassobius sp. Cn5-15]MCG7492540.1 hypothetical protein [Thalassobius sp. Cn5-15]
MLFHNGGTAGSSSALYICPETGTAFGVLSNNGGAGNLLGTMRLSRANQPRQAEALLAG